MELIVNLIGQLTVEFIMELIVKWLVLPLVLNKWLCFIGTRAAACFVETVVLQLL